MTVLCVTAVSYPQICSQRCACAVPTCHCLSAEESDGGGLTFRACQVNANDLSHGIDWSGPMSVNVFLKCL